MKSVYPHKIYVEVTTRCNLNCRLCVKHAPGSRIIEKDLPLSIFKNLDSALARAKTLILNGAGEPLLHAGLEEMVCFSRSRMAAGAEIGFQSNGVLLHESRCCDLLSAGLSTLCLSLDTLDTESPTTPSQEHSVEAVARAMGGLVAARQQTGLHTFRIGTEMVLTRENIFDLPRYVQWSAEHGADYILTTHPLPYSASTEKLSLFNPNSSAAVELFHHYDEKAKSFGVDLQDYPFTYLKYKKNRSETALIELFREMQEEARKREIFLHLQSLLLHANVESVPLQSIFAEANQTAQRYGVDLFLPPCEALVERNCPFIAEEAIFIAAGGDVMPCHFLWHTQPCRVLGDDIEIQESSIGNICHDSLEHIWQAPHYQQFRQEAGKYDYSPCWSCTQGPCPDLINDNMHLAHDCYGSSVPCGHCLWSLGGIRCL